MNNYLGIILSLSYLTSSTKISKLEYSPSANFLKQALSNVGSTTNASQSNNFTLTQRQLNCQDPTNCGSGNYSDICSPGCLFSDIRKGNCDKSCQGECFQYCDFGKFCSAGCSFRDLNQGICNEVCSEDCLEDCDSNCSPKCRFAYHKTRYCPDGCSTACCKQRHRKQSKAGEEIFKYLSIILPSFIALILITIPIIFILRHCKRRNEEARSQRSKLSDRAFEPENSDEFLEKFGLKSVMYNESLEIVGSKICTIDLVEFCEGDSVVVTKCFHGFHLRCLSVWLNSGKKGIKCPNCNEMIEDTSVPPSDRLD